MQGQVVHGAFNSFGSDGGKFELAVFKIPELGLAPAASFSMVAFLSLGTMKGAPAAFAMAARDAISWALRRSFISVASRLALPQLRMIKFAMIPMIEITISNSMREKPR